MEKQFIKLFIGNHVQHSENSNLRLVAIEPEPNILHLFTEPHTKREGS